MKLAISAPTGFHARELLLPLKELIEKDSSFERIHVISPAASYHRQLFPDYGELFRFAPNPDTQAGHTELIGRLKPDVVVTTTSGLDPNDLPILQAAHQHNIPTVTFIGSWDNVWKMEHLQQIGKPLILANVIIVWNTFMRDHLLRLFPDLTPERIFIIGSPRLDFFSHHRNIPSKSELLNYLNIPDDGAKLIHCATTDLYPFSYIVKTIVNAARRGKIPHQLHLHASVHPGGDITKHQKYARRFGITLRYSFGRRREAPHPDFLYQPNRQDLYLLVALFQHADLLIHHSSTVAIESLLGNTPVITVQYGMPLDWLRWHRSIVYRDFQQHYKHMLGEQATKTATRPDQLIQAVNDYLAHPEQDRTARQTTLKKILTTIDGSASQKVLDLIKHTANHKDTL